MPAYLHPVVLTGIVCALCASHAFVASAECFSTATARVEQTRRSVDQDDPEEMNRWYKQAIDANHAAMIHRVARINIARQHIEVAYQMYEKGAHLGDYQSMADLGVMWLKGEGRYVDLAKAYAWYLLAGEYIPMNWNENFFPPEKIKWHKALAGDLEKKMTPAQVQAGKQYYEEQKKLIACDWYAWLADYLKSAKKQR